MSRVDEEADEYDETEKRLNDWGRACRSGAQMLGMPTLSGIAAMIEHVRREDRLAKGVRKKKLRKARKAWKSGDPPIDAKHVAEELGYTEAELTAKGKETRPRKMALLMMNSDVLTVDQIVGGLPGWAKKIVMRAYLYGQPNRIAADEMRMSEGEYAQRRRAAVWKVAFALQRRYISSSSRASRTTPRGV